MKRTGLFATAIYTILISMTGMAQTGAEKKLIATLGPGETLAYGENCFLLGQDPEVISFVTVVGSGTSKQYYCYGKDGSRIGPVKSPDPKYWADCKDKITEDCVPNDESNMANMEKYYDFLTESVKFNGKQYGPSGQIILMNISKDEQYIYAVVMGQDYKLSFFDNTGRTAQISGMPEQIVISRDGKHAFVKVNGTINPFNPDEMQKMLENPEVMNNPKVLLVGINGTTAGPFESSSYKDSWFTESGQWVILTDAEIILNGKTLFKTENYIAPCDLWISSNGTDYAWADYNNIFFKDGTKFPAPLEIRYITAGGKGYLKWISLEEGKNVVYYKKSF
jgi:hypothetical protein